MNKRAEIQKIIDESSQMISQGLTSFRAIYHHVIKATPRMTAIVHHEVEGQVREYSYEQYDHMSKSVARKLSVLLADNRKKNGVIAIKLTNSPAWCFIFWAVLMCGYRPLLVDAKLAKDNTQNLLTNAKAIAIITEDKNEYKIPTFTKDNINDISEDLNFKENWADEVIFCSSGTTGDIKMMVFDGINMLHQLNAAKNMPKENLDIIYPQKVSPLRIIGLIPFHHIFAFVAIFLWYSFYNSTIVFTDFNDPVTLVKDIRELKVTHIYHVPLFYEVIAKNFLNRLDDKEKLKIDNLIKFNLKKTKHGALTAKLTEHQVKKKLLGTQIKYLISGGGYLNEKTAETINGLGYPLFNGYGMTELGVTSVELSTNVTDRLKRSIGRPLYKVDYKVNREHELLVKSPITHVKEIIKGKEKPTVLDKEGFFHTGDVASYDKDHRYYLKGRAKEVIIRSNGENVYPDEIESYYKKIKGVRNLAAFGAKNKIVLVIEMATKAEKDAEMITKSLPIHKQPNEIVFTNESLPLSSSLKVKRFVVKANYLKGEYKMHRKSTNLDILAGYDKTIKNDVVRRLNEIFKEILYLKKDVNGNAHWINDLHSDSMTYITLINEVEKEFVIKIPLEKYGKLTTLNEFAKEILDSGCK